MSRSIRTTRTRSLVAASLVIALGALTGCGGGGGGKDKNTASPSAPSGSASSAGGLPGSLTGQQLRWHSCSAPTPAQGGGDAPGDAWECATLKAPLDYAKPGGDTIDLALIRTKAKDSKKRIGSLIFNFGGPGGSGIPTLPGFAEDYANLNSRYDLVSFDPRGVGESEGVRCLDDKDLDAYFAVDGSPDDAAEEKTAEENNKKYNDACRQNSGRVLPYVDTVSAARDMDLMREVLGDKKLYYFGISYGTELGGVYAHLFPKNVGRSVLDAVVDPTEDPVKGAIGQAKGFQLALDNYMEDCAKKGPLCPTGKGGAEGNAKITAMLEQLDRQPLSVGGRKLTQDLALTGIAAALYEKDAWNILTLGLNETMRLHKGNTLMMLADSYNSRDQQGRYGNILAANKAVNCADDKQRYTVADAKAQLPALRAASPVFGEFMAWGLTACTGWPVAGKTDHPEVSAPGAAPIVVVGNTGDPATPYEGARKMAEGLGKGVGVEVTLHGQGHGGYNSGNACLTRTVDAYLLDGKVPAAGTSCS
ncbi:alpha/beta hydrolase [Streptomyces palmae]|uniref:Alpha/beta hydrolase n=1 Tax=Streptomyces palmae TaxID=1701085 RepID=A0A4Z0HBF8_9ACTN|nr:alpha/beta hydrolase [Streptomyces palmae]TGB13267.1 alpha/beta hydrolase [Streptomyces palmae]